MTRDDQILEASEKAYGLTFCDTELEKSAFENGFARGAEWADSWPNWRKFPEEDLPKTQDGYEKPVLVCLKNGFVTVGVLDNFSKTQPPYWCVYTVGGVAKVPVEEVTAWMERPCPFYP